MVGREVDHARPAGSPGAGHDVAGSERIFPARRLAPNGPEAWRQVVERGYEGYVAKDEASAYKGGARDGGVQQKEWTARGRTDGRGGFSGRTFLTDNQEAAGSDCLRPFAPNPPVGQADVSP
jgi:hypothetical protein